jgi:hypothetical protein
MSSEINNANFFMDTLSGSHGDFGLHILGIYPYLASCDSSFGITPF